MSGMPRLTKIAVERPASLMWLTAVLSAVMIALVAVPTLAPNVAPGLQPLKVDTDPENMLAADEPVRVYHNEMKAEFGLNDLIVVGVVAPESPEGVFTPRTLTDIHALTEFAKEQRWTEDGEQAGVIRADIIAPSTVDSIEQAGLGSVSFNWLMPEPPDTAEEARAVREKAQRIPMLDGTLVSGEGLAIALYIPIAEKDDSYRVANALREKIASFDSGAEWHITGLPIAQDQFGVEMFKQMAISAPAAMVLILILMFLFFRNANLVFSPMVVAMASVIGAMGALVVTGNTVHIMSSMIPIFVMPIAVLDAVHILSDFYDRYPEFRDRRKTLAHVMEELWQPMFFTTVTTCVGFLSLALTPIPPVRVFGIFVSLGVFLAWFFTVTLVPAYIMLMPERALRNFGAKADGGAETGLLARMLRGVGRFSVTASKPIVALLIAALAVSGYGISLITINDNPVKWFTPEHEIRVADRALNERFAGTYMAYLTLTPASPDAGAEALRADIEATLGDLGTTAAQDTLARLDEVADQAEGAEDLVTSLIDFAEDRLDATQTDEAFDAWDEVVLALDRKRLAADIFKRPDVLRYIEGLQRHLEDSGQVGKTNALPDVVKTVHRDLFLGEDKAFRIPDTPAAVAQTLITYQNSHRPQDLFKLVTPDYRKVNLWLQLKSGDNIDMKAVTDLVADYVEENPAPVALEHDWFGLTYINVVWQEKMVAGMMNAFISSFAVVLVLMIILFRSLGWGLLSMVPLTVTIAVIYGVIGFIGKDYDMPVAVLSSLSLGLAIDYAIHFNARSRQLFRRIGNWKEAATAAFGEPARAIARNVIVIGAGFLPLLFAPLVPYQTVGVFISAILVLAGVTTLLALPALITIFQRFLFPQPKEVRHAQTA